ncbi:MAG: hypothetical protein HRU19_02935 [Pseudobacteriovorax sp.]|nr:hypothetical protein [Pseudobacteriovorax sp.]
MKCNKVETKKQTITSYDDYLRASNRELERVTLRLLRENCPIDDISNLSRVEVEKLESFYIDEIS